MERDLDALLPLPAVPYDACDKQPSRVSSLSLVRYRTNDYSAPVAYGHREVLVRGYVDQVVISCGAEVIARLCLRSHAVLERKTAALDRCSWDCRKSQEFGRCGALEVHHAVSEFASTPEAWHCCAAEDDHLAWILTCIPTCPGSACRPPAPRTT